MAPYPATNTQHNPTQHNVHSTTRSPLPLQPSQGEQKRPPTYHEADHPRPRAPAQPPALLLVDHSSGRACSPCRGGARGHSLDLSRHADEHRKVDLLSVRLSEGGAIGLRYLGEGLSLRALAQSVEQLEGAPVEGAEGIMITGTT